MSVENQATVQRQGQVTENISHGHSSAMELEGIVNNLEERLIGILRSEPPVNIDDKVQKEEVPIAYNITEITTSIMSTINKISSILDRLEL